MATPARLLVETGRAAAGPGSRHDRSSPAAGQAWPWAAAISVSCSGMMMRIVRTLVLSLTLSLFVAAPALAQSVEVKDLHTGAAVKLAVDGPVRLVLPSDRMAPSPAVPAVYRRGC